jgi:putative oxidoreductase
MPAGQGRQHEGETHMSIHETAAPRPMIPGLAGLYQALAPYSYSFMRFCVGAMLIPHGYVKLFEGGAAGLANAYFVKWGLGAPLAWGYGIALLEFVGGILLAVGLLTRPVAFLIAVEMAVAVVAVHLPNGFFWVVKGYEYPLLWGLMALAIAVRGGDRLSVDRAIGAEI